jgi:hypothetical protein
MNDLEARILEVLREDADRAPFVGAMPEQVRPRVRRRQAATIVTASLAAAALVAGSLFVVRSVDRSATRPAITPSPQPTQSSTPDTIVTETALPAANEPVALDAGTYLVAASGATLADYTVTVPEGWTGSSGVELKKNEDTPQGMSVLPWAADEIAIFEDACHGELGDPGPVPANVAELVSALRAQRSGPIVGDPVATTLGGLPATRVDLDYPDRMARADCRIGTGQLQVWDGYFVFFPNHTASLYIVDLENGSQVFVVDTADDVSAADRAELQAIVDSISFEPAG